METVIGGVVKNAAWGILPVSVKIIASIVYASVHAKETIDTVTWLSSLIPRAEMSTKKITEEPWIWVTDENIELG